MAEKLLSIVTGCYNEVENIPLFYERCLNVLQDYADEYDYEFIVADNCSTDGTRDVLREIAKRDKKFRVIMNAIISVTSAVRSMHFCQRAEMLFFTFAVTCRSLRKCSGNS